MKKQKDTHPKGILGVQAIVLANLCVSYIMTSQNEEAEELMREIEKQEEEQEGLAEEMGEDGSQRVVGPGGKNPTNQVYHLCIVNLVIGTLYCAKGNFEFGVQRIIKSLEPYDKKIGTDTWFYAKRCFCAVIEVLSKHMILLKDASYLEIVTFLDEADRYGKEIPTQIDDPNVPPEQNNVSYEARLLKKMFLKLRD